MMIEGEKLQVVNTRPAWIITADHVEEDNRHVGFCSGNWTDTIETKYEFHMRDGDEVLLYEGKSTEEVFNPLDAFGMPNAGATSILYKNAAGDFVQL